MKYAQALVANTKMRLSANPSSCSALPADKGGRTRLASRPRLASVVAASADSFRLSCHCLLALQQPFSRRRQRSGHPCASEPDISVPTTASSPSSLAYHPHAAGARIDCRPRQAAALPEWMDVLHVLAHEALPPQPPLGNLRAHALYSALPRGLSLVRVRAAERAPPCPTPYASTIVCAGRGPACLSV